MQHWCLLFYVYANTMDDTWCIHFTHDEETDWAIAFLDILIAYNKMAV